MLFRFKHAFVRLVVIGIMPAAVSLASCASLPQAPPGRHGYAPVLLTSVTSATSAAPSSTMTVGVDMGMSPSIELPIPPEAPRGRIVFGVLGVTDVTPPKAAPIAAPQAFRAVLVRVVVENDSETNTWFIDEAEQTIQVRTRDGGSSILATATPTGLRPPIVSIGAQRSMAIDLLFRLPPSIQSTRDLPAFDLTWTVHDGARAITSRLPFERFDLEPTPHPTAAPQPVYEPLPLERRIPSRTAPERAPLFPR